MPNPEDPKLITSKEVMQLSGISRATLNNYIKMGIIPKPVVQKPPVGMEGIKKIGYFPRIVLDRIDAIKGFKKQGQSMEEIAKRLGGKDVVGEVVEEKVELREEGVRREELAARKIDYREFDVYSAELKVTFEDVILPSYLVNYNFQVEWINPEAEDTIFKQAVRAVRDVESRSIFRLLFNWEFHSLVQNWKDMASFHMSFAKAKFSKTWISKLYKGISIREISILEEIYDKVSTFPKQVIQDTPLNLLLKDGTTESYRVYSILLREGMFFSYAPARVLYHGVEASLLSSPK
jgi:DNA-binding transcriptional MerR regulator